MSEQKASPEDIQKQYFLSLLTMLAMSVMQQLGKLKNPATGKIEISLEAAQASIDMLDMLESKTKGNLDQEEEKLLKDTLANVKLNYVEAAAHNPAKHSTDMSSKEQQPEAPGPKEVQEPSQPHEHKEPKFHKSYE